MGIGRARMDKFPKLLTKAEFKNSTILFRARDLNNDELYDEFFDWRESVTGGEPLRLSHLKRLHRRGQYTKEIFKLFSSNGRLNYLE